MNYETSAHWARGLAVVVSAFVGVAYGLHLHNTSGSTYVAVGFGLLFAVILAGVWHVLLWKTQLARHNATRAVLLAMGIFLTVGAIIISGRAVTTLIGGNAVLKEDQAIVLQEFEGALSDAYQMVQDQDEIVSAILQASTQMEMLANEEGRGGQGPRYRNLMELSAYFYERGNEAQALVDTGDDIYQTGSTALSAARKQLGDEAAFDEAIATAQMAIRDLNGIDASGIALKAGVLTHETGGKMPQTNAVTNQLHATVKGLKPEPVEVPVYDSLTANESVAISGKTAGYWFTSIIVESVPLLMMILLMLTWREPLMREPDNPASKTDDDIRARGVQKPLPLAPTSPPFRGKP